RRASTALWINSSTVVVMPIVCHIMCHIASGIERGSLPVCGGIGRRLSLFQNRCDIAAAQKHFVEIALQGRIPSGEACATRGWNARAVQHGEEGCDVDALSGPVVEIDRLS